MVYGLLLDQGFIDPGLASSLIPVCGVVLKIAQGIAQGIVLVAVLVFPAEYVAISISDCHQIWWGLARGISQGGGPGNAPVGAHFSSPVSSRWPRVEGMKPRMREEGMEKATETWLWTYANIRRCKHMICIIYMEHI